MKCSTGLLTVTVEGVLGSIAVTVGGAMSGSFGLTPEEFDVTNNLILIGYLSER
jgi:hypothetical protein